MLFSAVFGPINASLFLFDGADGIGAVLVDQNVGAVRVLGMPVVEIGGQGREAV